MLSAKVNTANLLKAQQRMTRAASQPFDFTTGGLGLLVGTKMKQLTLENWEKQADPITGRPWPAVGGLRALTKKAGSRILEGSPASGLKGSINAAVPYVTPRTVSIGTNKPYARLHQEGGEVKAKPGKSLAAPLTSEAARAGTARRFREQRKEAFIFVPKKDGRVVANSTQGGAFIAEPVGKLGKKIKLHFLLRKKFRHPARRFLGWGSAAKSVIMSLVAKRVASMVRGL